ncbi:hypothetical protein GQ42DRAFT_20949 [Ramicandelaber brevisporus]|nr:hypothetical protein GQ42DRAFT_70884 [Ramicandelaber brevisporus]KAI8873681.1 hypothetical protein GQ42DRAFT_20949 [Ramicandelaber brevisporus]
MDSFFTSRTSSSGSTKALFALSDLSPSIRSHLASVYAALASGCIVAAAAAHLTISGYLPHALAESSTLLALLGMGLLVGINAMPVTPQNNKTRMALFYAFAATEGLAITPLIEAVLSINPRIVTFAAAFTAVIFGSFSLSALASQRRSWLYLGGLLGSTLSLLAFSSLINIFVRSTMLFSLELYLGLAMFAFYIIYDTQLIVEQAEMGHFDVPGHAADLLLDVVGIVVRIMIILARNSKNKDDDDEDDNGRGQRRQRSNRRANRSY